MPTLPADEDYARALLSVFRAKKIGPRQSLRGAEARAEFLARNLGREHDFEVALSYAISRRWLWSGFDRLRLTGLGDEEMSTIWPGRNESMGPPPRWGGRAHKRLDLPWPLFWRAIGAVKRTRTSTPVRN